MSHIFSWRGGLPATFSSVFSMAAAAMVSFLPGLFVPSAMAQAVQEMVITGNPLSKTQSTSAVSSLSGLSLL